MVVTPIEQISIIIAICSFLNNFLKEFEVFKIILQEARIDGYINFIVPGSNLLLLPAIVECLVFFIFFYSLKKPEGGFR